MQTVSVINRKGFTIVELLIVVVVIAILASITIVAYSGIRASAEKSATLVAVRSYIQGLSAYKAGEGSYPTTSTYCLGSGYTDRAGDSNLDCRWGSGNVTTNTSFNTTLSKYTQVNASIAQTPVMNGTAGVIGMYFMNDSLGMLDGKAQLNWLVYAVPNKKCGMNVPLLTNTYPQFTTKANDTVSEEWGLGGLCWVPLN